LCQKAVLAVFGIFFLVLKQVPQAAKFSVGKSFEREELEREEEGGGEDEGVSLSFGSVLQFCFRCGTESINQPSSLLENYLKQKC
jgi:hypothetical protein